MKADGLYHLRLYRLTGNYRPLPKLRVTILWWLSAEVRLNLCISPRDMLCRRATRAQQRRRFALPRQRNAHKMQTQPISPWHGRSTISMPTQRRLQVPRKDQNLLSQEEGTPRSYHKARGRSEQSRRRRVTSCGQGLMLDRRVSWPGALTFS